MSIYNRKQNACFNEVAPKQSIHVALCYAHKVWECYDHAIATSNKDIRIYSTDIACIKSISITEQETNVHSETELNFCFITETTPK